MNCPSVFFCCRIYTLLQVSYKNSSKIFLNKFFLRQSFTSKLLFNQCIIHVCFPLQQASAAKSLRSCLTLCDPIDGCPPGSPVPGILQARTLEWVAISFSSACKRKVKVKSLSSVGLFETPWTAAYQAPPSMGFSRQEYWSGLPLPSPIVTKKCLKFCSRNRRMSHKYELLAPDRRVVFFYSRSQTYITQRFTSEMFSL